MYALEGFYEFLYGDASGDLEPPGFHFPQGLFVSHCSPSDLCKVRQEPPMEKKKPIKLRPLEREDLRFVHSLDNDATVMRYWFEEPFESFMELSQIYEKHIHDQMERRFIIDLDGDSIGLVELIEINHVHRRAEFQVIIDPRQQGKGYASIVTRMAIEYAFYVLNLNKVYLRVDQENARAIHIYEKIGFQTEGILKKEFFANGQYRDVIRMCIFQAEYQPLKDINPPGR